MNTRKLKGAVRVQACLSMVMILMACSSADASSASNPIATKVVRPGQSQPNSSVPSPGGDNTGRVTSLKSGVQTAMALTPVLDRGSYGKSETMYGTKSTKLESLECNSMPQYAVVINPMDSPQDMTGWSIENKNAENIFNFPQGGCKSKNCRQ